MLFAKISSFSESVLVIRFSSSSPSPGISFGEMPAVEYIKSYFFASSSAFFEPSRL